MIHYLIVRNMHILSPAPECVQNSQGYDRVDFIFDSEWSNARKVVTFGTGTAKVSIEYFGEPLTVPASVLTAIGNMPVSVVGYTDSGRIITAEKPDALVVVASGNYDGDAPYPEAPDLLEQLLAASDRAREAAKRANDAADRAEGVGSNDYERLTNLPSINGTKIMGDAQSLEYYGAVQLTEDDINAICV